MRSAAATTKLGNAWFFPPPGEWKALHFYNLPETNRHIELEEGRLRMFAPEGIGHQRAVKQVYGLLSKHVRMYNYGLVFSGTMPLQVSENIVRQPDLMVVKRGNKALMDNVCVEGPADFIIEVIDSETLTVDTYDKMKEYASLGVPEYWIINPEIRSIKRYQLDFGRYRPEGEFTGQQVIESFVIDGFKLKVDQVF